MLLATRRNKRQSSRHTTNGTIFKHIRLKGKQTAAAFRWPSQPKLMNIYIYRFYRHLVCLPFPFNGICTRCAQNRDARRRPTQSSREKTSCEIIKMCIIASSTIFRRSSSPISRDSHAAVAAATPATSTHIPASIGDELFICLRVMKVCAWCGRKGRRETARHEEDGY